MLAGAMLAGGRSAVAGKPCGPSALSLVVTGPRPCLVRQRGNRDFPGNYAACDRCDSSVLSVRSVVKNAIVFLTTDNTDFTDKIAETASMHWCCAGRTWRCPMQASGGKEFTLAEFVRIFFLKGILTNSGTDEGRLFLPLAEQQHRSNSSRQTPCAVRSVSRSAASCGLRHMECAYDFALLRGLAFHGKPLVAADRPTACTT